LLKKAAEKEEKSCGVELFTCAGILGDGTNVREQLERSLQECLGSWVKTKPLVIMDETQALYGEEFKFFWNLFKTEGGLPFRLIAFAGWGERLGTGPATPAEFTKQFGIETLALSADEVDELATMFAPTHVTWWTKAHSKELYSFTGGHAGLAKRILTIVLPVLVDKSGSPEFEKEGNVSAGEFTVALSKKAARESLKQSRAFNGVEQQHDLLRRVGVAFFSKGCHTLDAFATEGMREDVETLMKHGVLVKVTIHSNDRSLSARMRRAVCFICGAD